MKKNNVDFYLRPKRLGSSRAKSDDVVEDFCNKFKSDIIVWLNPICPFQPAKEISSIVKYFVREKCNSLITCARIQTHCIYKDKPINYQIKTKFARTQDLDPIMSLNYSIMMWQTSSFLKAIKNNRGAILHGQISYYEVGKDSSIMIKTKKDLIFAEAYLSVIRSNKKNVKYHLK